MQLKKRIFFRKTWHIKTAKQVGNVFLGSFCW